jgi:hypothetical protein
MNATTFVIGFAVGGVLGAAVGVICMSMVLLPLLNEAREERDFYLGELETQDEMDDVFLEASNRYKTR